MEKVKKKTTAKYLIASIFMLVFMMNDLMFDFLFSFDGSNYISFLFTLATSVLTFIGCKKVLKTDIINRTDKISSFVKSTFSLAQVVFSTLDLICGVISLLSGLMFFATIFKFMKIFYIPLDFLKFANKSKVIVKSVQKFSLIWTIGRILTKNYKGEDKMKTWIKNNKMTLAYSCTLPLLSGYVAFLEASRFELALAWKIVIAIAIGLITIVLIVCLGGDKVKQATFRAASYELNNDNYIKVTAVIDSVLEQQKKDDEIHQLALKQLDDEEKAEEEAKKAKEQEALKAEQKVSDEEKQALINAEIERIKEVRANSKAKIVK